MQSGISPADGDVIVVAQKVVSKAENRFVDLATIVPSPRAVGVAAQVGKDPRLVEVILSESRRIVRQRPNVLIVEHRLGFVTANAGVDQSNVAPADGRRPCAAVARGSRSQRRDAANAIAGAIRCADRGRHQRQFWASMAARHDWYPHSARRDCPR
jgi:coenzyme F420-0:L-glutamate ligase/coenzyme F420-1:gamma-L-glutamate ligase